MVRLVKDALAIINGYDWNWRMDDSNFRANEAKAKQMRNEFSNILKKFSTKRIAEINVKQALKKLWVAKYDLSTPFMSAEYYSKLKEDISAMEEYLNNEIIREKERITQ